jgi:hypothetical protein
MAEGPARHWSNTVLCVPRSVCKEFGNLPGIAGRKGRRERELIQNIQEWPRILPLE